MRQTVICCLFGCFVFAAGAIGAALAHEGGGPFVLHPGKIITTMFANDFGQDADARTEITSTTPEIISLQYSSTRGCLPVGTFWCATVNRQNLRSWLLHADANRHTGVYVARSLSSAALQELRSTGTPSHADPFGKNGYKSTASLTTTAVDARVPVIVEDLCLMCRPLKRE